MPHVVATHGLSGAGKSPSALKYAELQKSECDPTLWIDASNIETIKSNFKRYAVELGILIDPAETKATSVNDSEAAQAVFRWLFNHKEKDES